jgi:hypothetical protein
MGGENTLYYPLKDATIGAQRAYFKIGEDGTQPARLTSFHIDFGEEANGIKSAEANASPFTLHSSLKTGWYTLDGRKLAAKPSRAGVYINNGNMVVIK